MILTSVGFDMKMALYHLPPKPNCNGNLQKCHMNTFWQQLNNNNEYKNNNNNNNNNNKTAWNNVFVTSS